MAAQSAQLAALRPIARGPPAYVLRRARAPIGVRRLSMPTRDFAYMGKIR